MVALEPRANPAIISRAILHEPAVTDEGAGLGAAPVLLEMIAAERSPGHYQAFLEPPWRLEPGLLERPKQTKHALRNGRGSWQTTWDYYDLRSPIGIAFARQNGGRRAPGRARLARPVGAVTGELPGISVVFS